ncbi:MAG TPA: MgtC/SapB family protein [Acidimicrobiia bacterium]
MFQGEYWDWLLALAVAAALGSLIGGERESRGHPAGIRTQALVALAAALLTRAGKTGFIGPAVDLSRVASQVVTGIGFIGAGVILKHRGTVTGLTTAATLFLSAGIGIAVGADLMVPALFATGIALVVIYGLRLIKPWLRSQVTRTVQVEYLQGHGTFGPLVRTIQDSGATIQDLRVEDRAIGDGELIRHVSIQVLAKQDADFDLILQSFLARPEVRDITIVEG